MKRAYLHLTLIIVLLSGLFCPWSVLAQEESERQIRALLEQLTVPELEQREKALFTLKKLGKTSIPYLVEISLNQREPLRLRNIAIGVLGDVGHEDAMPALQAALDDSHISIRWNAIASLGKIGTPIAVTILVDQLRKKDESSLEQYYAREALLKLTNPAVIPTLAQTLRDPMLMVVYTGQEALAHIGGEEVVSPLAQTLQHAAPGVRRMAAEALKKVGHPKAIPFLKEALEREDEGIVKVRIAGALTQLGDESGRTALILLIQHRNEGVKEAAIRSVGELAVKEAVPVLMPLLESPFSSRRALAVEALGEIGDPTVTKEIEEISQKDISPEVRETAAKALEKLKTRQGK